MERLDQLMVQCREDIADIASSECDITSTSNRLLYELATVRQSTATKSDQDAVKMNIEAMLNILIAYTSSDSAAFCSSIPAVQSSQRGVIKQHCTVTDLVGKCALFYPHK